MTVNDHVSEQVERLRQAAKHHGRMSAQEIRKLALNTDSKRIRNAAVIALADLNAPDARDTMLSLLRRSDTRGARGTILYALSEIGAHVPLPLLVTMLIEESEEGQEEALGFLHRDRAQFSDAERRDALGILSSYQSKNEGRLREVATTAISYLAH